MNVREIENNWFILACKTGIILVYIEPYICFRVFNRAPL